MDFWVVSILRHLTIQIHYEYGWFKSVYNIYMWMKLCLIGMIMLTIQLLPLLQNLCTNQQSSWQSSARVSQAPHHWGEYLNRQIYIYKQFSAICYLCNCVLFLFLVCLTIFWRKGFTCDGRLSIMVLVCGIVLLSLGLGSHCHKSSIRIEEYLCPNLFGHLSEWPFKVNFHRRDGVSHEHSWSPLVSIPWGYTSS